jgi:hypothetical protein
LLNLSSFFHAQRCAWIARSMKLCIDNWRYDLYNSVPGNNLQCICTLDIDKNLHPILYNLVDSYEKLVAEFSKIDGNYSKAYIFNNRAFMSGDNQVVNVEFFGRNFYSRYANVIRNLKFEDCFQENRFKSIEEFSEDGLPINHATWWRLQLLLLRSRQTHKKPDLISENRKRNINDLFTNYRKGSKLFRQILEHSDILNSNPSTLRIITTFYELTGTGNIDNSILKRCLGSWHRSWLPSNIKNFIFRFRGNILPLSNRVHRYDPLIIPDCFFCRIRNDLAPESFRHCFWLCRTVCDINNYIFDNYFPGIPIGDREFFFWYGTLPNQDPDPELTHALQLTILDIYQYIIFSFKTRRIVPNVNMVINQLLFLTRVILVKRRYLNDYMQIKPVFARILQATS